MSIVSILVIIMMFAFSMQLMSIAPMYVTFGDQKQANGDFCDLKAIHLSKWTKYDSDKCNITMIAQLYTKILLSVPLFSLIYYLLSWAFVALFIIFLIYHSNKRAYQSQHLAGYSSLNQDDDSEQDEDLQAFIRKGVDAIGGNLDYPETAENSALNAMMQNQKLSEKMEK